MHKFSTVARLLAGASAVAFASVAALPAHAQTSTYSVTGQTPLQISLNQQRLGNGQLGNLQSLAQGNYTYNYVTVFFTPTTNVTNALFGVYEANFDPVSILYVGSFDPLNPSANAIIGNDDNSGLLAQAGITPIGCGGVCSAFTTNLTAGQTYYLFLSTYSSGTAFTTPVSFFATGTTFNWGTFVGTPTTTDIDTSSPSGFDAANLGSTLNPVFNGGTLYFTSGNNTYADNFRLAGNSGNALDVTGQVNTLSGQLTDATSGGAIRFINSGTGGHIVLSGNSSYTGATTVETGADIRLTGSILNTSGMTVNNGGVFVVSNGGRLTAGALNTLAGGRVVVLQGGTLNDDMDNAGTYENAGTTNAIVNSNSGSILNDTTGVWTGQVRSNTGTLTNAGVWTGNIASSGTLVTTGTLNGTLSNSGRAQARGTITGAVTNAGNLTTTGSLTLNSTLSNSGTVSIGNGTSLTAGGVVNLSGGQVLIAQGGTLTDDLDTAGSVDNAGAANAIVNSNSGTILNRSTGVWTGQVRSNTGTLTNAGVWTGNIASSGTLVTTGTLNGTLSNSGTVQARGTITGAVTNTGSLTTTGSLTLNSTLSNSGTVSIGNGTSLTAGGVVNLSGGQVLIAQGGTLTDDLDTAGSVDNAGAANAIVNSNSGTILNRSTGVWTGQVRSNTGTLTNAGVWTGNIASSGTLVTTGTLTGTLSNSGTVQARGTITGAVTNTGSLTTTGSLTLNSTLSNSGTVSIGNGTSLTAGGVVNLSGGQVLIAQGGTLTDDLDTAGSVDNAGAANAIVNSNSGTILNRSTGVWTGQVRSNTGTLTNAGVWTGNIASSGTLVTTGTLNGTLSNSGRAQARGTITGAVTNTGSLTTTGSLTLNSTLSNSGTVSIGNGTSLTAVGVVNLSGGQVLIAQGGTLTDDLDTAGSVDNAGAANAIVNSNSGTILNRSTGVWTGQVRSNTGTLTNAGVWTGNIASSGTLVTTGTLTGTLSNSGRAQARGTITGAVTNTGSLTLIGETAFNGASITNSGTLNVNATTLNGAGNVTNAAVGTILVGTTAGAGHLTAGSLSNAGTVAMLNGRTGDTVTLSGAYSGAAGSVLTFDVDLSTGAADRLSAASLAGQSVVRLRNLGTAKTYLSAPIVLITAGSSTATFTASTDADTQSALSRNALISYDFRQLGGSSDWGIVSTLNTSGLSSLATGVSAFVTGQNLSLSDLPDSTLNASGTFGANQWMGHSWAETYTSQTDLRSAGTISDAYSLNGSSRAKALQDGSQYGFDAGVYNIAGSGMNLRAGILAGSTDGKSRDSELIGAVTTYDVPHYGYYVMLNSAGLRLSVQNRHDLLRLKVSNPVLSLSGAALKGRGDTLSATVAGLNTLGRYVVEPSAGYVESLIDLDALALPNGMGSVEVARLKSQAYHAGIKVSTTFSGHHVLWQPYGELSGWKETAADTQTAYRPGSDSAPVWIGGQRLDTFAQASVGVAAQMRTHPDLTGFVKANAHSGDRLESWSIRAGVSYRLH